jgi:phospholipase D3/4
MHECTDLHILFQVKELGLLGMNCESLALDLQRLFDVYWYLSTPGNSLPPPGTWPQEFSALHNMTTPAVLSINDSQPASAFLAVSKTVGRGRG